MKKRNKVKCKLCRNYILRKTAYKYQGYSRQCLVKINSEFKQDNQIKERLTAVLPKERPVFETDKLIWFRNWNNKLTHQVKIEA